MNNIYKVSQSINNTYDTYDSIVCSAKDEAEAKTIMPWEDFDGCEEEESRCIVEQWAVPEYMKVELIGTTDLPSGIILASFNAG